MLPRGGMQSCWIRLFRERCVDSIHNAASRKVCHDGWVDVNIGTIPTKRLQTSVFEGLAF